MRQKQYFQCVTCGHVHYIEGSYNIDRGMYEQMWCSKCGGESDHLWVGNEPEDIYLYGDNSLDKRFFIY